MTTTTTLTATQTSIYYEGAIFIIINSNTVTLTGSDPESIHTDYTSGTDCLKNCAIDNECFVFSYEGSTETCSFYTHNNDLHFSNPSADLVYTPDPNGYSGYAIGKQRK